MTLFSLLFAFVLLSGCVGQDSPNSAPPGTIPLEEYTFTIEPLGPNLAVRIIDSGDRWFMLTYREPVNDRTLQAVRKVNGIDLVIDDFAHGAKSYELTGHRAVEFSFEEVSESLREAGLLDTRLKTITTGNCSPIIHGNGGSVDLSIGGCD